MPIHQQTTNFHLYFWGRPITNFALSQPSQQNRSRQSSKQDHSQSQQRDQITRHHENQLDESGDSFVSKIDFEEEIEEISCGMEHCFLRTKHFVYGFGNNELGQLGISMRAQSFLPILKILFPFKTKIKALSCGWNHTLILNESGEVFSSGDGSHGALGYGSGSNSYIFQYVLAHATSISAGNTHSLALLGTKVYGWGSNVNGELGLLRKRCFFQPKELHVYPCRYLYAGPMLSFFITTKGLYGTGLNNTNQLGLGHNSIVNTPKLITIPQQITSIQAGNYIIASVKSNQHYLWGSGVFGTFKYPTKLSFLKDSVQIAMGMNFGLIQMKDQKVKTWGVNKYGQLGSNMSKNGEEYAIENQLLSSYNLQIMKCGGNYVVAFGSSSNKSQNVELEEDIGMNQNNLNEKVFQTHEDKVKQYVDNVRKSSLNNLKMSQELNSHNFQQRINSQTNQDDYKLHYQQSLLEKSGSSNARSSLEQQYQHSKPQKSNQFLKSDNSNNITIKKVFANHAFFNQQLKQPVSLKQYFKCNHQTSKQESKCSYQNQKQLKIKTQNIYGCKTITDHTANSNYRTVSNLNYKNITEKERKFGKEQQFYKQKQKWQKECKQKQKWQNECKQLREKLDIKTQYLSTIREEYFQMVSIVEDNKFLKKILEIGDENYHSKSKDLYHQGIAFSSEEIGAFQHKLQKLKIILENVCSKS